MQEINTIINYLLNENPNLKLRTTPKNMDESFRLYRSLVNIRKANPISKDILEKEDHLLQEYIEDNKKITRADDIPILLQTHPETSIKNKEKIALWQGDITSLEIGSIVNAANSQGLGCFVPCHNCIDNQINTYAGIRLRLACDEHMKKLDYNLHTGEAFTTKGYNLKAEHVIHTVGPIITGNVTQKQEQQLANCYFNVLEQAKQNNIKTVAFCSISTGEFRFPKTLASQIAIKTVDNYLNDDEFFTKIVFDVYSDEDRDIYENTIRTY